MLPRKRIVLSKQHPKRVRHCFGLPAKGILQFLSSLILPLMLGVFTVVIAFQQQKLAQEQRTEDMNLSRQQRLEDRDESQLQREQDKNESQLRREQDWKIAEAARVAQNKAINDQYHDEVFVAYIKEMGDLLEKKNGSLTSDPFIRALARIKTLNALRQVNDVHRIHILRFLHEAGQLTNTNESVALDMSTAELIGMTFLKNGRLFCSGEMSLAGVYFEHSTFTAIPVVNINFSSTEVYLVNFMSTFLDGVTFSSAEFYYVNFTSAELHNVNFSSVIFYNVSFPSARLSNVDFSFARRLENVNFSSTKHFCDINFSWAKFLDVNFSSTRLQNVDFSFSEMASDMIFPSVELCIIDFSSVQFVSNANHFHRAKIPRALFNNCDCQEVDFTYANLKNSSFYGAMLSKANFYHANLENADFTNSTITDEQLRSAASIRNAKLPNGTLGQARNLIKNGNANCNTPLADHWQIENGNIAVVISKADPSQCQFSVQSVSIGASMSQQIDLVGTWDATVWRNSSIELQAQISRGVSIELIGKNITGATLHKYIANSTHNKINMELEENIQKLEVMVKFDMQMKRNSTENIWCDNIELFINYDTN